jgi:hypothetical protein
VTTIQPAQYMLTCALGKYLAAQSSSKCMALETSHDNEH